ncbi:MAG: rhamnogalacturonan acetylesterase [Mariniphaga sp.]|nr:rhamnogalacturonan acetylesterase [Mariniphaga sp.]
MKRFVFILSILITICCVSFKVQPQKKLSIFLIGDSTMADKKPDKFPETGWGQALSQFFFDNTVIKNHAVNGRSTKSFITEGRWQKVLEELKNGDYVFIQFGHNDQKFKDSSRYTNPYSSYRANLSKFVSEAREKGAISILCTSVVRRNFNDFGTLIDTHGAYPEVSRSVAKDLNTPLIDLQILTEHLVISTGPEKSKELFLWVEKGHKNYPEGKEDNTHFNNKGAKVVAELAIKELKKLDIDLKKHIK